MRLRASAGISKYFARLKTDFFSIHSSRRLRLNKKTVYFVDKLTHSLIMAVDVGRSTASAASSVAALSSFTLILISSYSVHFLREQPIRGRKDMTRQVRQVSV